MVSLTMPYWYIDSIISQLQYGWVKDVYVFRCNLPPALLAEWVGCLHKNQLRKFTEEENNPTAPAGDWTICSLVQHSSTEQRPHLLNSTVCFDIAPVVAARGPPYSFKVDCWLLPLPTLCSMQSVVWCRDWDLIAITDNTWQSAFQCKCALLALCKNNESNHKFENCHHIQYTVHTCTKLTPPPPNTHTHVITKRQTLIAKR